MHSYIVPASTGSVDFDCLTYSEKNEAMAKGLVEHDPYCSCTNANMDLVGPPPF